MPRVKRFLCLSLCLFLIFVLLPLSASAQSAPALSASSAILIDKDSGSVLFEKNADERLPMASTTKIMTALVALSLAEPTTEIRVPSGAVGIEGSSAYLKEGEVFTLEELLYALLLQSANDAAAAIAISLSGSVEVFVEEMNRTASALGLTHTHFDTPGGLDGKTHYTTARDLARLTKIALEHPLFARIVATKTYTIPASDARAQRSFVNHNKLLFRYAGCVGVKTGFTKKSGRCLVSAAERDGVFLIAVTLDDPDDWRDHETLFDYGFSTLQSKTICRAGEVLTDLPLVGGLEERLSLAAEHDLSLTLPKGAQLKPVFDLPPFAYAPIESGERVGALLVYSILPDAEPTLCGSVPLVANEDHPTAKKPSFWKRIVTKVLSIFRKETRS